MIQIDLNCDLGEGGDDSPLMPLVTSVNIACGGHAGDERTMRHAVALALEANLNIGAHPSYDDRAHFGRVALDVPSGVLRDTLVRQIGAIRSITHDAGAKLRHVKPHGALYNAAVTSEVIAAAAVDAVLAVDPSLAVLTLPHGCLSDRAAACGLEVIGEAFADRSYQPDGTLTPRSDPHALLSREIDAVDQVLWIVRDGCVRTADGQWIPLRARTICVHGDGPRALPMLRAVKAALAAAGIALRRF